MTKNTNQKFKQAHIDDDGMIARAANAHHHRCVRNGLIFAQPNRGLLEVDGDLKNERETA